MPAQGGEVRDTRDRYRNIEVSYLLQPMEYDEGFATLTRNWWRRRESNPRP